MEGLGRGGERGTEHVHPDDAVEVDGQPEQQHHREAGLQAGHHDVDQRNPDAARNDRP